MEEQTIIHRILAGLDNKEILNELLSLSKSDLNSLLIELYRRLSVAGSEKELLKSFQSNRFAVPSDVSPLDFHQLEVDILAHAKKSGVESLLLSPVVPFGTSSAFGCVNQNNILSAIRGTEVLSDPTNMLAILIADNYKTGKIQTKETVHYCTTARVLRAQAFFQKGYTPSFGIFGFVSSGKDTGSYNCEKELIAKQIHFYLSLFQKVNPDMKLAITLSKRSGYPDGDGFFDRMSTCIRENAMHIPLTLDTDNEENQYYKGLHFKLLACIDNSMVELVGGGFVEWVSTMAGNSKLRCLTSGIGMERLLVLKSVLAK